MRSGVSALVPREHGFWVMATAVLLSATVRAWAGVRTPLVALAVLGVAAVVGGLFRRVIRRDSSAQLLSSGSLALLGLPVEFTAGFGLVEALLTASVWASVFVSSALLVRATFLRAKGRSDRARRVTALALCTVALVGVAFGLFGRQVEAISCAVAAAGLSLVVVWNPTVKQLKPVGLSLAAIALLTAGTLGL